MIGEAITERAGTLIGPYKLMEQIGEGGVGMVFVVEVQQPRLKIIKPGMDTRDVIARFEAERQALALMDHPNIARVLDAGTTESGRPFFVMELVQGISIVEYCDQKPLCVSLLSVPQSVRSDNPSFLHVSPMIPDFKRPPFLLSPHPQPLSRHSCPSSAFTFLSQRCLWTTRSWRPLRIC